MVEILAVKSSMAGTSTGPTIFQANLSKSRRLLDTGTGRTSRFAWANRSSSSVAFFVGQAGGWEMFPDTFI